MTACDDDKNEERQVEVIGHAASPDYDTSFLRDMADIVKNKTLFFIPFFSAYLAFLFVKTDYIKNANFVIWIFIGAIFLASVRYINLVSQLCGLQKAVDFRLSFSS